MSSVYRPRFAAARLLILAGVVAGLLQPFAPPSYAQATSGGEYAVSADPGVVPPGGSLSVSWTAPAGRPAYDWVGLYRVGTGPFDYL